jgi:uncharacterized membrane protein YoaK (UPF0700 family)
VLPFVLSVTAGATDMIGFLGLNGLFTAHVTGNLLVLAAHLITGMPAVISHLLAVPVFMVALLLTRLLANALRRAGIATLRPLLLLQLAALTAFLTISVTAGPWSNTDTTSETIAGMSGVVAMAVQNALVQISLPSTPPTAVMTTNITHLMMYAGDRLTGGREADVASTRDRALRTIPLFVGFSVGCGLGAVWEAVGGLWSLLLPTGLALVALLLA